MCKFWGFSLLVKIFEKDYTQFIRFGGAHTLFVLKVRDRTTKSKSRNKKNNTNIVQTLVFVPRQTERMYQAIENRDILLHFTLKLYKA